MIRYRAAFAIAILILISSMAVGQKARPSIRGRILYPNGKIAPGAVVLALKKDQMTGRILTATSDDQGRFVIAGVQIGTQYSICASKQEEGYLNPYGLPFGLSTGGLCKSVTANDSSEVDVFLAPLAGAVEGQVRDARTGISISNGKVVVYRRLKFVRGEWAIVDPHDATWTPSVDAVVDNGRFKIIGLPNGIYFLKVEVPGRPTWYFNNQMSDAAAQPLVIQAGLTRRIVVRIP